MISLLVIALLAQQGGSRTGDRDRGQRAGGRSFAKSAAAACTPTTCGATCGQAISDGCGNTLLCGPCDAGVPGFQGFAQGTYGWGPECSGLYPTSAADDQMAYAHSGNATYTGTPGEGMLYDNSMTCCKSNGDCVEMVGDDPATGSNLREAPVALQYGMDSGTAYGIIVDNAAIQNLLAGTRDLSSAAWINTATVTANTFQGPFGYYLSGPGGKAMAQLNDTSAVLGQGGSQTVLTTSAGFYALSCWLKAGTATAARLSLAGTGNAAGDRTCTITGLSTAAQGQRYGCVTPVQYTGAVTALTVAVTVGAANADTGTIGASDCQLEQAGNNYQLLFGVVTTYIPNLATTGTVTRGVASALFQRPDAGLVGGALGCAGIGYSAKQYDSEASIGYLLSGTSGGGALGLFNTGWTIPAAFANADTASTYALASPVDVYANHFVFAVSSWDAGSGQKFASALGITGSSAFGGELLANTDPDVFVGSSNGINGTTAQVGPISWGNTTAACNTVPPVFQNAAHFVLAVGDAYTFSAATDPTNPSAPSDYPSWLYTARQIVDIEQRPSNIDNRIYYDGGCCNSAPSRLVKYGYGTHDTVAFWLGSIDLANGVLGAKLFTDAEYYAARKARMGMRVFFFNMPPSGGTHQTQTEAFNLGFANYCDAGVSGELGPGHPEPNLWCIDAHAILAPDGGDTILPLLTAPGVPLSDAGAIAIGNEFIRRWSP